MVEEFPITINFEGQLGTKKFANPQQLRRWLQQDLEKWQQAIHKLGNHHPRPQDIDELSQFITTDLSNSISQLTHIEAKRQNPSYSAEEYQGDLERAKSYIKGSLSGHVLLRDLELQEFILDQINSNPASAFALIIELLREFLPQNLRNTIDTHYKYKGVDIQGVFAAMLYKGAIPEAFLKSKMASHTREIARLKTEYQSLLDKGNATLDESKILFDKHADAMVAQEEKIGANHSEVLSEFQEGYDDSLKKAQAELEAITKTFHQFMALEAPTQYWSKKADDHKKKAMYYGIAALLVGALILLLSYGFLSSVLGDATVSNFPVYKIGEIVLFFTLTVWLLRILVRTFLSNMHLKQDAEERSTMIETYLALSESKHVDKETINLILNAIFRHSSDGLVKDDSMPLGLLNFLTSGKA